MGKVAFVTVHGMGETPRNYADKMWAQVRARIPLSAADIAFGSAYYQKILQDNEGEVWRRVERDAKVRYGSLRRFLLFGIGDAAGLENRKEDDGSVYELAQLEIARTLMAVREQLGANEPLVLLTHSLGCQVMSNYIYDAQKAAAGERPVTVGIWQDIQRFAMDICGRAELTGEEIAFLRCDSCTGWITTGCNIPMFVAAHKNMTIIPIRKPNACFRWINVYDPDDVLGWPMEPLSDGYRELVEDRTINAGNGVVNWLLKSWNPLSHELYWSDEDVLDPLLRMLAGQ